MNLKNRSKVSAEFNMSSMTDMVFLLLIFFMLTSTLVTTSALDVILPKSKAQTVKKSTVTVTINPDLQVSVNSDIVDKSLLETAILEAAASDPEAVIILRADESVPTGETVRIMDIAYRNRIKMVLATDPS
ncbi:MAG: biopolymer transporter ExbD [Flavobacteriia bacterium]|jgi:biopolymer transport protein ExbD|nr:biopolymer transporter ExbD [Flavobacteriia bacterium]NDH89432.1 biopolymer transporter ExbD [Flavobacteriia bacterium]